MPNISQSKGNQAMKLDQLIEYNKRNIFFQNLCKKWGRETSSRPLFIFLRKLDMRWKQVICSLVLIYSDRPYLLYNKDKLHKTLGYWSRDMLNYNFSGKGLELVSPPHFMYDFWKKMFLVLHSINWSSFIAWLPLLWEILGIMCISTVC